MILAYKSVRQMVLTSQTFVCRQSSETTGRVPLRLRGDRAHHGAGADTAGHPEGRQAQAAALGAGEETEDQGTEEGSRTQPGLLSDGPSRGTLGLDLKPFNLIYTQFFLQEMLPSMDFLINIIMLVLIIYE